MSVLSCPISIGFFVVVVKRNRTAIKTAATYNLVVRNVRCYSVTCFCQLIRRTCERSFLAHPPANESVLNGSYFFLLMFGPVFEFWKAPHILWRRIRMKWSDARLVAWLVKLVLVARVSLAYLCAQLLCQWI